MPGESSFPSLRRERAVLTVMALWAILATSAAWAQTSPLPRDAARLRQQTTAATVGYLAVDFRYANADSSARFHYDGVTRALMLSSEDAALMVAYGVADANPLDNTPETRLIEAALAMGGNNYVFEHLMGIPVGVFVPVRLNLGYRGVQPVNPAGTEDAEMLHLASAGLGAGGGVKVRSPRVLPVLEDRLVGFASLVFGAGATTDVATELKDLGLMGSRDFNLEARLERFLGNKTGLTVGYTYRQQNWALGRPESAQDVLDAFLEPGRLAQKSSQHMFRIGLNF